MRKYVAYRGAQSEFYRAIYFQIISFLHNSFNKVDRFRAKCKESQYLMIRSISIGKQFTDVVSQGYILNRFVMRLYLINLVNEDSL